MPCALLETETGVEPNVLGIDSEFYGAIARPSPLSSHVLDDIIVAIFGILGKTRHLAHRFPAMHENQRGPLASHHERQVRVRQARDIVDDLCAEPKGMLGHFGIGRIDGDAHATGHRVSDGGLDTTNLFPRRYRLCSGSGGLATDVDDARALRDELIHALPAWPVAAGTRPAEARHRGHVQDPLQ